MIAAVVTAGVVLLALIAFALDAMSLIRDAERRCADTRVDATAKAGLLAIAATDTATQKARAERAEDRANALDEEMDQVAADGDAAGARDRVLRRKERQAGTDSSSAGGGGAIAVPGGGLHPGMASGPGDDLAKPGD